MRRPLLPERRARLALATLPICLALSSHAIAEPPAQDSGGGAEPPVPTTEISASVVDGVHVRNTDDSLHAAVHFATWTRGVVESSPSNSTRTGSWLNSSSGSDHVPPGR